MTKIATKLSGKDKNRFSNKDAKRLSKKCKGMFQQKGNVIIWEKRHKIFQKHILLIIFRKTWNETYLQKKLFWPNFLPRYDKGIRGASKATRNTTLITYTLKHKDTKIMCLLIFSAARRSRSDVRHSLTYCGDVSYFNHWTQLSAVLDYCEHLPI